MRCYEETTLHLNASGRRALSWFSSFVLATKRGRLGKRRRVVVVCRRSLMSVSLQGSSAFNSPTQYSPTGKKSQVTNN